MASVDRKTFCISIPYQYNTTVSLEAKPVINLILSQVKTSANVSHQDTKMAIISYGSYFQNFTVHYVHYVQSHSSLYNQEEN